MKGSKDNYFSMLKNDSKGICSKELLRLCSGLETILRSKKDQGATDSHLIDLYTKGRLAILADITEIRLKEQSRVTELIGKEFVNWTNEYNKDFALHDFNIRNHERKFRAMDDGELKTLTKNIIDGKVQYDDFHIYEALNETLAIRNIQDNEIPLNMELRDHLKSTNYDQPWLKTEQGKILNQALKLAQPVEQGAMFLSDDGKYYADDVDSILPSLDEIIGSDNEEEE